MVLGFRCLVPAARGLWGWGGKTVPVPVASLLVPLLSAAAALAASLFSTTMDAGIGGFRRCRCEFRELARIFLLLYPEGWHPSALVCGGKEAAEALLQSRLAKRSLMLNLSFPRPVFFRTSVQRDLCCSRYCAQSSTGVLGSGSCIGTTSTLSFVGFSFMPNAGLVDHGLF